MVEFISSWSGKPGKDWRGSGYYGTTVGVGHILGGVAFLMLSLPSPYHPRVHKHKRRSRGYVSSIVVSPYHKLWLLSAPHY